MRKIIILLFIVGLSMVYCVKREYLRDHSRHIPRTHDNVPGEASANGKYYDLLQVVNCPQDSAKYGQFYDWGYWSGTSWCNQQVQSGYWVWVQPNWYIWRSQR